MTDDGARASLLASDSTVARLFAPIENDRSDVVAEIKERAAAEYLPLLCTRLADSGWLVRSLAIGAAQTLWRAEAPAASLVARTLLYGLGDEHSLVTMAAQEFLRSLPVGTAYNDDVVAELLSPQLTLRGYALRALVSLQEIGIADGMQVSIEIWQKVLSSPDVKTLLLALNTLGRIDHLCPAAAIEPLLANDNVDVRALAQELIDEM